MSAAVDDPSGVQGLVLSSRAQYRGTGRVIRTDLHQIQRVRADYLVHGVANFIFEVRRAVGVHHRRPQTLGSGAAKWT